MSETLSLIESLLLQTWYVSCRFRNPHVARGYCHYAASSLESRQYKRVHTPMFTERTESTSHGYSSSREPSLGRQRRSENPQSGTDRRSRTGRANSLHNFCFCNVPA